ncbi:MAG: hypothetical protein WCR63_05815 [Bacilli bacterium]|jgi:hypothetical protein
MEYKRIIDDIQVSISQLQQQLDTLRLMDKRMVTSALMTRQEAADFIGESVRQFDRDCQRYGIEKLHTVGGIRVRKSEVMRHMGLPMDELL